MPFALLRTSVVVCLFVCCVVVINYTLVHVLQMFLSTVSEIIIIVHVFYMYMNTVLFNLFIY